MRFAIVLVVVLAIVDLAALVQAHRAGAPPGYTAAPGEETCAAAGCHDTYELNSGGSLNVYAWPIDANRDTLEIGVAVTGTTGGRFGFQLTALDTLGNPLGTWLLTDTVNTRTVSDGSGRAYVEQTETGAKHATCSNCQNWYVRWLSPLDTVEPVVFYFASVSGNNDSLATGDYVRTESQSYYYRSALCWGLCGDLNANHTVSSADLIILTKSVNYAFLVASDNDCAEVDDYEGVNLRDEIALASRIFRAGPELDCIPDHPPYVPLPSSDFVVAMNSVVPAESSVVRIFPEFRATSGFGSFSADFRFDVEGVIPKILGWGVDPPPEAGWEDSRIEYPSRVEDSIGIVMLTCHDWNNLTGPPDTYPLGWFDIRVAPAPYARRINFVLEGYFPGDPPGFNTPMMLDSNLVGYQITPVYYTVKQTGDINNDSVINSSDVIGLVNYVFKSGGVPYPVPATGDVNCSASVTSADIIQLVNYVFKSGMAPCDVEAECTINLDQWSCP